MQISGRLFSAEESAVVLGVQFPRRPVEIKLLPLETAIFTSTMEASQVIEESWVRGAGQGEMPFLSNWAVRIEELGFFLHMVNRLAFAEVGNDLRAFLQDYFAIRLINSLVDNSCCTSSVEAGFERIQYIRNMKLRVLDIINDAEMDYRGCQTMLKAPFAAKPWDAAVSANSLTSDDTDITGCLAKRIAAATGLADTFRFRELVWFTNVKAVSKLQIVPQVEAAIKAVCD